GARGSPGSGRGSGRAASARAGSARPGGGGRRGGARRARAGSPRRRSLRGASTRRARAPPRARAARGARRRARQGAGGPRSRGGRPPERSLHLPQYLIYVKYVPAMPPARGTARPRGRLPGLPRARGPGGGAVQLAAEIQQRFGAAAARYAESDYHGAGPDLAAMLEAARLRGDERVLDVGCGAGHTALRFAPRVTEVVAVDLTEAMLEQARSLAAARGIANVRCERGDAQALAYPDASFDVVTCRVCAHHFARPERAVREAARVLRPG